MLFQIYTPLRTPVLKSPHNFSILIYSGLNISVLVSIEPDFIHYWDSSPTPVYDSPVKARSNPPYNSFLFPFSPTPPPTLSRPDAPPPILSLHQQRFWSPSHATQQLFLYFILLLVPPVDLPFPPKSSFALSGSKASELFTPLV